MRYAAIRVVILKIKLGGGRTVKVLLLCLVILLVLGSSLAFGQDPPGKLQIHFMDVGQGDGAVLLSPTGEVVLFDHGHTLRADCSRPVDYLKQLGITKIDYLVTSHYHDDHLGCTQQILDLFPLQNEAIDRGGSYSSAAFNRYVAAIGSHRRTAEAGTTLLLGRPPNWVSIEVLAVNADGLSTTDENSLSIVAQIRYGGFRAEIDGDLTGTRVGEAVDVESVIASRVGRTDVYKVHHHCSRYSSNDNWLAITTPTVAIVSMGDGNPYGHAHQECMDRLHTPGRSAFAYWTEFGNGAQPQTEDIVASGAIVVETSVPDLGPQTFTVTVNGRAPDTYTVILDQ